MDTDRPNRTAGPGTHLEMLISSLIGLIAALVLSIEAWQLASTPDAIFSCDINTVISCGTVARSWQAQLLGFPNAFLGLIFEPIVITIGLALLARVRFPRWYLLSAQGLYTIAVAFAYWLFFQSYFIIGAVCPWCLAITVTTTLVWTSLLRHNLLAGHIKLPVSHRHCILGWVAAGADTIAVIAWLGLLTLLLVVKYHSVLFGVS